MAIRQSLLRDKATKLYAFSSHVTEAANAKAAGVRRSAFLCHSHKDETLAKGLVVLFQEAGVTLYVDWMDHTMPETPNKETAEKIQSRIQSADIFLFLATENSKSSRWCPWEIGYADASKRPIYVVPTSDGHTTYGNEYLELYPKIDVGINRETQKEGYAMFQPQNDKGIWISNAAF